MRDTVCPECQSKATYGESGKAAHPVTGNLTVVAYWQVCLVCWHKWDGVTDGRGRLPAGVVRRKSRGRGNLND